MTSNYYILRLWQTGNIGSDNIKELTDQPKEGFNSYEEAEEHLLTKVQHGYWNRFCIMKLYKP